MHLVLLCLPTPGLAADVHADLHVDTPTQLHRQQTTFNGDGLESGLAQMREGGTNLAVEVLWPPREADWDAYTDQLFNTILRDNSMQDAITLVKTPMQAQAAIDTGRIAMLVALEGAHGIDKRGIGGLRDLHAAGLSMLGLTWSFSNQYAGSSGDQGGGVTAAGWGLVVESNRLGVILDLSHASDQTTMEVCGWSHAPVIASHSNTDAIRPHARNLSDEAVRCIARSGGVIGVNFHADFVGKTKDISAVADHADALRRIGGAGVVALGSDFDGLIKPVVGLPTAGDLPALWAELHRRGWSDTEIRGMQGANFMRTWLAVQTVGAALRGEAERSISP